MADLPPVERHRQRRVDACARHAAGRRVHAGRDVDRDHRDAERAERLDSRGRVAARRTREPGAEERVDYDIGATLVVGGDRHVLLPRARKAGLRVA